jgi:hypothetical protein
MAKKSGSNKSPAALKVELEQSRERVARDLRGLRYELDFPQKMRRSFQQQTGVWITAAAVVGVILVVLPHARKKVYVDSKSGGKPKTRLMETGFLLGALRIAATLLKPAVVGFIKQRMASSGEGPRRPAARW